jgi:predicted ATP-grasp superfamily ATP-dependent carboligase
LADGFPAVAGPTGLLAQLALDKRLQLQHAAGHLAVLPTVVADPAAPAGDVVPDAPGPWIVKPAHAVRVRDGRLGKGRACIAETAAAVRAAVEAAAEPMLVQPVAAGVGEGVFGFCHNGEVLAWSGHRRIRMMNPAGSGSSACRSVDVEAELASAAEGFLRSAQWTGLFMLEFLRADVGTDSVAWFMELNGRTWGSMPLARHRGLPYPVWAVQAAAGLPIRPAAVQPEAHLTARHLGRELVHLAFLLRGRRSHPEWPTVRASLLGMTRWRRGDRFYNFDHRRPAVFLSDTLVTLASQLRPRGRSRS